MLTKRNLCVGLLSAAIVWLVATHAVLAEDMYQIVDFRDGTVMRVAIPDQLIPWRNVSPAGDIAESPVKLSKIQQLSFVTTPATEQLKGVRRMVDRLGDPNYHVREKVQRELIAVGGQFRTMLEKMEAGLKGAKPSTRDYEVLWRLRQTLNRVQDKGDPLPADYDKLSMTSGGKTISGDAGDWSPKVVYRGAEVVLDRTNVLSIRNAPLDFKLSAEPEVATVERIQSDDARVFPSDATRVDFDRQPDGNIIPENANLSEIYVPAGVTIATSIEDSYVARILYNVGGSSGEGSAATREPLYQGTLTIRFCKPGNARLPAGVHYVGFWISHVIQNGTTAQAFDGRGRHIGSVETTKLGRDFLGMHSNVPIAFLKIVPDVEIDEDYAIDDLVFDPPKTLAEAGDPDRFSVVLKTGERLHGQSISRSGNTVTLNQLTIGTNDSPISVPISVDELAVLIPPRVLIPEALEDSRCLVRLSDGSVLRATSDDGLHLARFTSLRLDPMKLVALWGASTMLEQPSDDAWPASGGLMVLPNKSPVAFADWTLGKPWIEAVGLADYTKYSYENSPALWFRKPTRRPPTSGLLRTRFGEEIVLGNGEAFSLRSWSSEGIELAYGDQQWTIPMNEIGSLLLPQE